MLYESPFRHIHTHKNKNQKGYHRKKKIKVKIIIKNNLRELLYETAFLQSNQLGFI